MVLKTWHRLDTGHASLYSTNINPTASDETSSTRRMCLQSDRRKKKGSKRHQQLPRVDGVRLINQNKNVHPTSTKYTECLHKHSPSQALRKAIQSTERVKRSLPPPPQPPRLGRANSLIRPLHQQTELQGAQRKMHQSPR